MLVKQLHQRSRPPTNVRALKLDCIGDRLYATLKCVCPVLGMGADDREAVHAPRQRSARGIPQQPASASACPSSSARNPRPAPSKRRFCRLTLRPASGRHLRHAIRRGTILSINRKKPCLLPRPELTSPWRTTAHFCRLSNTRSLGLRRLTRSAALRVEPDLIIGRVDLE